MPLDITNLARMEQYWGYGLYNNTVNEVNILDVFSRIFKTIETIDNQK
ncbi:hypothetical protein HNQ85_002585 [Anoxybacillus calidus]|uniref:Uncharacterized protein n=1 Tax=[Anoxybacillus] calidus TaxID=575178 RepID=A0A7W0BXF2_9BACL|nr:hypothetical protein [Anoxybacillus calidus]